MISIVVPCYNAENSIKKTVESLLDQTVDSYQIVLVDDGSTDNTSRLCDQFALLDTRIKVVHQDNRGLMGAWKTGVLESDGDYIAFCDADDYVDDDFVERINWIINEYKSDIICFGLVAEYTNGYRTELYNRLPEGIYNRTKITNDILPFLFSDGRMQSEVIIKSRWSKAFRKSILISIMPMLNEQVNLGEDQLTMFASIQKANTLYCMGKYCPYHYVRSSMSMIGQFDRNVFDKIDLLYRELDRIAEGLSYMHMDQLLYDRLSVTLLSVKKYICKSTDGYRTTMDIIKKVRRSSKIEECIEKCSIKKYKGFSLILARLFIHRRYLLLYYLPRVFESIRGRNV